MLYIILLQSLLNNFYCDIIHLWIQSYHKFSNICKTERLVWPAEITGLFYESNSRRFISFSSFAVVLGLLVFLWRINRRIKKVKTNDPTFVNWIHCKQCSRQIEREVAAYVLYWTSFSPTTPTLFLWHWTSSELLTPYPGNKSYQMWLPRLAYGVKWRTNFPSWN